MVTEVNQSQRGASTIMSTDDLKLEQLETKAAEFRGKRTTLFEQVNKWRDEREKLNESSHKIREEALKHKEERDRINARVAEVKAELQPLFEQLDEKRKKLAGIEEEINNNYREIPKKRKIERDLNSIEWTVMTTPTREMLDREQDFFNRANELRKRLNGFKKPPKREEATLEATAETKATEMEIRNIRDEMNQLREQSQQHHETMLLLFKKAEEEREKANQAHAKFVENITEIKSIDEQLDAVMLEIRGIRSGLKAEELREEEKKKEKLNAHLESLRQEALRKMEAGEKLTFEDLKFIYGEDDSDEDESDEDLISKIK